MSDAWGALIGGSNIDSGDAWEHLNAQGGGSKFVVLTDGMSAGVKKETVSAKIDKTNISISVGSFCVGVGVSDKEIIMGV